MRLGLSVIFLILSVSTSGHASLFDADFEPCYKNLDTATVHLGGEKLLDGDKNFILLKPHTSNSVYYQLNCPRRVFALQVLKAQTAGDEVIKKAIDTLAYQATFSPEAATTLIEFIKTNPNQELRGMAAKAFYFLLDIFPNVAVQVEYYGKPYFKEFFLAAVITEKNREVSYWIAQVAQKNAGYFYAGDKVCYRKQYGAHLRQLGEKLAEDFLPLIINALNARAKFDDEDNLLIKNELLVAINNFSYSRYLKYNKQNGEGLASYLSAEASDGLKDLILSIKPLADIFKGQRKLKDKMPQYDSYCRDSVYYPPGR